MNVRNMFATLLACAAIARGAAYGVEIRNADIESDLAGGLSGIAAVMDATNTDDDFAMDIGMDSGFETLVLSWLDAKEIENFIEPVFDADDDISRGLTASLPEAAVCAAIFAGLAGALAFSRTR